MGLKIAALSAVLILAIVLCPHQLAAQAVAPQQSGQPSGQNSASLTPLAIPTYPDSPEGLAHLMKDMLKLQKSGDAKNLAPYVQSLILPNPAAWFTTTFGEKLGTTMASDYDRTRLNLPLSFPDTLNQMQSKHLNKVQATLFTDSCNLESTNLEYRLLISRAHEQPLYHVRLSSGTQAAVWGLFAYVDGAFRYISYFKISTPAVLQVGGKVMAKKEISAVPPRYPMEAKQNHVSGTVVLHAIIGPNGQVCSLQVVSGPPELIGTSLNAVRQWRYSPTTLNKQPVSIDTTISVVFTIGG